MFKDMFAPYSKTYLRHIWTYSYAVLDDLFIPYNMKTCSHNFWKQVFMIFENMFTQNLIKMILNDSKWLKLFQKVQKRSEWFKMAHNQMDQKE